MGKVLVDTATAQPLFTLTVEAEGATEKFRRFVRADGARCGAGDRSLGVCRVKSSTDGDLIPVDVHGVVLVEAAAPLALAEGDVLVMPDGQGRAVLHAGAVPVAGRVLAASAAAGDIVPCLLIGDYVS